MRRAIWVLPLLFACGRKPEAPQPAPPRPEAPRTEPEADAPPLTIEQLRSLHFPENVRIARQAFLPGQHRWQIWAENHAVRMVIHGYDDDGSVRYEARRDELGSTTIENRYGYKSYLYASAKPNEEYGVPSRHVEIGFVKGKKFCYVMAGNLEQDIPESDLVTLVRRAVELIPAPTGTGDP